MKYHLTSLLVLAMSVLLAATAQAAVVTVDESSYAAVGGWSWTSNYGLCFFSNAGPCLDEGEPFLYGNGAFYGQCTYNNGTGVGVQTSTNWIGTDTHAGQSLEGLPIAKIKTMTYSTYVSRQPTMLGGGGVTDLKWPRMPFYLQITFLDATGNRRQVWYRPWGTDTDPRGSNYSGAHVGIWEEWDAVNTGKWYCSANEFYGPWDDPGGGTGVIQQWPGATLVATSTYWQDVKPPTDPLGWKSPGWDWKTDPHGWPPATATGKCLNFTVGARKGSTTIFGSTTPAWYTESVGFKGYVDNFTLGIDFDDDGLEPEEEVTYDFETNKPPARVVAMNNLAPYGEPENLKHLFRFKIFGKVMSSIEDFWGLGIPDPTLDKFWIWDGSLKQNSSGSIIPACWEVICPGHVVVPGEYVSVIGRREARIGTSFWDHDPDSFWSNAGDCVILHSP